MQASPFVILLCLKPVTGRFANVSFRQLSVRQRPRSIRQRSYVSSPTSLTANRSYNMFADNLIPVWSVYRCKSVNIPFEHILRIYIFLTRTGLFSSITLEIL